MLFSAISVLFKCHFKQKTTSIKAKSSSRHCEISDDVLVTESFQVPGPPALAPRPHTPLHRGSSHLSPKSRHFNLHTPSFFLLLLILCVTRSHDTIKKKRKKEKTKQNKIAHTDKLNAPFLFLHTWVVLVVISFCSST